MFIEPARFTVEIYSIGLMNVLNQIDSHGSANQSWVKSLFSTSGRMREAIDSISPALESMSDNELGKLVNPTPLDQMIRANFWLVLDSARRREAKTVSVQEVTANLCAPIWFYERYLKNPQRMAWLMRPLVRYDLALEAITQSLYKNLFALASIDVIDKKTGDVIPENAKLVLQVFKMVDMRKYGNYTNHNINEDRSPPKGLEKVADAEFIEAEANRIESKNS